MLDTALQTADRDVARALDLPPGGTVAMIRRLQMADGVPLMVEVFHLAHLHTTHRTFSVTTSPGRYTACSSGSTASSWSWAGRRPRYGAPIRRSRALGLPERSDVFFTERLARGESGTGIEFTRRYARTDRCRFRIELTRGSADVTLRN